MGRRVKALEEAVGQKLFQRTSDGFVLTEEGAAVLSHAEQIEQEAQAFERRLRGHDQALDGSLRVSCSDWFGLHLLAPVIAEFAVLQPRVTVELLTDARLYSLARREADLVFRIAPFDEADVIARRLIHIRYAAYLHKGAPPPRAGDGAGTDLITMDTAFGGMPDAVWLARMLPNARIAIRSNNRDVPGAALRLGARDRGAAASAWRCRSTRINTDPDLGEPPPGHRHLCRLPSRSQALGAAACAARPGRSRRVEPSGVSSKGLPTPDMSPRRSRHPDGPSPESPCG